MFTLNKKYVHLKKQIVMYIRVKYVYSALKHVHSLLIGGPCQLLWTVIGTPYKRASAGTRFVLLADHSTASAALRAPAFLNLGT